MPIANKVLTELIRSKLNVDWLMLRQQQGFIAVMPSDYNIVCDQSECTKGDTSAHSNTGRTN